MKRCWCCGKEKTFEFFHKNRLNKDGFSSWCKECRKQDRKDNIEKYRLRDKIQGEKHSVQRQQYRQAHQKEMKKYQKEYYIKNKDYINLRNKTWRDNNKEWCLEYIRKRCEELNFRISKNLRTRLYLAIKNEWKSGSAVNDLGCSIEELVAYLESKFYVNPETNENMSWDNYGKYGWHIDHIKPLTAFDLSIPEQIREACHYTNLQPMWMKDNISKGGVRHGT